MWIQNGCASEWCRARGAKTAMWSYLAVFWQSCGRTTEGLAHKATSLKGGKKGLTTLGATEFLRRFCLHILPLGFTRLRYYGILASRSKPQALAQARESLEVAPPKPQQKAWQDKPKGVMGLDLGQCPCCKTGRMRLRRGLAPTARSPPRVQVPTPAQ